MHDTILPKLDEMAAKIDVLRGRGRVYAFSHGYSDGRSGTRMVSDECCLRAQSSTGLLEISIEAAVPQRGITVRLRLNGRLIWVDLVPLAAVQTWTVDQLPRLLAQQLRVPESALLAPLQVHTPTM